MLKASMLQPKYLPLMWDLEYKHCREKPSKLCRVALNRRVHMRIIPKHIPILPTLIVQYSNSERDKSHNIVLVVPPSTDITVGYRK